MYKTKEKIMTVIVGLLKLDMMFIPFHLANAMEYAI